MNGIAHTTDKKNSIIGGGIQQLIDRLVRNGVHDEVAALSLAKGLLHLFQGPHGNICKMYYARASKAATSLATAYREHRAAAAYRRHAASEVSHAAATRLAAACRAHIAASTLIRCRAAATCLAAAYRAHIAASTLIRYRAAATCLAAAYRAHIAASTLIRYRAAATRLAAAYRAHFAASTLIRSRAAATRLAATYRRHLKHRNWENEWTAERWLSSVPAVSKVLAEQLSPSSVDEQWPAACGLLSDLRQLGTSPTGRDELLARLQRGRALEKLADALWPAVQELAQAEAATASELTNKYLHDGIGFDLRFGDLSTFFGGLEKIVGQPDRNLMNGMELEHCKSEDSTVQFTTPNYSIETTSQIEWHFVVDPDGGLNKLGIAEYPKEHPSKLRGNADRRQPIPRAELKQALDLKNAELEKLEQTPLEDCELVGGRLCRRSRELEPTSYSEAGRAVA